MSEINFYALDECQRKIMLEICLGNKGQVISTSGGMCGEIYIFDQGEHVSPRYICAKVPKLSSNCSKAEADARFINELKKQLSFYHHQFVHWAFDFKEVMDAPVALFRYWGSDLKKLINDFSVSHIQKLSIMAYICAGLIHCYNKGLVSHQDLKPENIFLRDIKDAFIGLPDLDIYMFALVADFGLANAFIDSQIFDGSRPYMAPEQWSKSALSSKTDVFALGVIFFQLMTEGYHPVGIKLREYWPKPRSGNSKKWTKSDLWEKWSQKDEKISKDILNNIESDVLALIREMLSTSPIGRPSMESVLTKILLLIKESSLESYNQMHMLINYFNGKVSSESLEEQGPYLAHSWKRFESKFGGGI
jgi:serine/threonine protein kinase